MRRDEPTARITASVAFFCVELRCTLDCDFLTAHSGPLSLTAAWVYADHVDLVFMGFQGHLSRSFLHEGISGSRMGQIAQKIAVNREPWVGGSLA